MNEYSYEDLRNIEYLDVVSEQVNVNGVTVFHIDEFHFQEVEQGPDDEFDPEMEPEPDRDFESHSRYVQMRLLSQKREIARVSIQADEKLIVDENQNYMIIPVEGLAF